MRDPFPASRINGIMALSATQSFYSLKETATKVMPAICHLTMDPDKSVRDQAFKALKGFIGKLEKVSEDPSLAEQMEADLNSSGSQVSTTMGATWASWAVSSITNKFYRSSTSSAPSGVAGNTGLPAATGTIGSSSSKETISKENSLDSDKVTDKLETTKEISTKTDGWDDDWQDDDEEDDEVIENKPVTHVSSKEPKSQPAKEKNDWDEDNWESSWTESKPSKPVVRRKSEISDDKAIESKSSRRVKSTKGPLKLGAQKIS